MSTTPSSLLNNINIATFITQRSKALQHFLSLPYFRKKAKGKTPIRLRRKCASPFVRGRRKKRRLLHQPHRRRITLHNFDLLNRHRLSTHVWHAKRFHMVNVRHNKNVWRMPYCARQKQWHRLHRGFEHGCVVSDCTWSWDIVIADQAKIDTLVPGALSPATITVASFNTHRFREEGGDEVEGWVVFEILGRNARREVRGAPPCGEWIRGVLCDIPVLIITLHPSIVLVAIQRKTAKDRSTFLHVFHVLRKTIATDACVVGYDERRWLSLELQIPLCPWDRSNVHGFIRAVQRGVPEIGKEVTCKAAKTCQKEGNPEEQVTIGTVVYCGYSMTHRRGVGFVKLKSSHRVIENSTVRLVQCGGRQYKLFPIGSIPHLHVGTKGQR